MKINGSNNACVDMEAADCGEATDVSNQAKHGLDLSGNPNYLLATKTCYAAGNEGCVNPAAYYNPANDACEAPTQ